MKIVVPTNDFVNMERKTGHAQFFAVFNVENENIEMIEKIVNDHDHEHGHNHDHDHDHSHDHKGLHIHQEGGHQHGHKEQVQLIKKYDAFVVNHLGPHFLTDIKEADVNYFMTRESDIKEAIKDFLANGKH
jgi:predicted Fe-Mo cluster-binding NifX family protein